MAVPADLSAKKGEFGIGLEDALLLPVVAIAAALRLIGRICIVILINVLDFTFPLLIQLVRFPLFTARILGDAAVAMLKAAARVLPLAEQTRSSWQARIGERWEALRASISYRAFEEGMHHLFERGMAWVFRSCRKFSPRKALWVIVGAALWLPVSFGIATAIHALLLVYAAALPAWMQLLHPVATFIAKSKLLVLPVYPAAWPQAKQDPFVHALRGVYSALSNFHLIRKAGYRYRQVEMFREEVSGALVHASARLGITHVSEKLWNATISALAWPVKVFHWSLRSAFSLLSRVLLIGPVLRSYAAHYAAVEQRNAQKTSERIGGLFETWSIRFSAEYYERKEREKEAKAQTELAVRTVER